MPGGPRKRLSRKAPGLRHSRSATDIDGYRALREPAYRPDRPSRPVGFSSKPTH